MSHIKTEIKKITLQSIHVVVAFVLAMTLTSCTTYTRPDTSEAQTQADLEECKDIAYGRNPGAWTTEGPDYQARNSVGCASGDCQAKPGQAVHQDSTYDMNRADRERAIIACMEDRGYSL